MFNRIIRKIINFTKLFYLSSNGADAQPTKNFQKFSKVSSHLVISKCDHRHESKKLGGLHQRSRKIRISMYDWMNTSNQVLKSKTETFLIWDEQFSKANLLLKIYVKCDIFIFLGHIELEEVTEFGSVWR